MNVYRNENLGKSKKEYIIQMNLIKKGLLTLGATAALAGTFAVNNTLNVEAAEWEARTVEEVKTDIQSNGVESRYTIQWGDTLGTIANALEISINQIVNANEIANRDLIIAGNTLHLSTELETVFIEDNVTHEVEVFELEEPFTQETITPVEDLVEVPVEEAATETITAGSTNTTSGSEAEAKAWIAFKESTDNYNARNGQYIGKYQLTDSYLNGDFSPENQERVADEYVASRYGSWVAAKEFWLQNGWY